MSSNGFGTIFRITTFGESHGAALGVIVEGLPPSIEIDEAVIRADLLRRRPGQGEVTSSRRERDEVEILSGVFEGRTTGAPVCMIVRNHDQRPEDYEHLRRLLRPGHADVAWLAKYGARDHRGGGRSSGRETVGRVAAGALARRLLEQRGVSVMGHCLEIGGVRASLFDSGEIERNPVRCADAAAAKLMTDRILSASAGGDSVGGIVEIRATGVPPGWGDPVFGKLDARLAEGLMSIGSVKGVEVGDGFASARSLGSGNNDEMTPDGFLTNHSGGILGGVSTGQTIVTRIAVKPTPSIRLPQRTVTTANEAATIRLEGRHDPCICPRLVPVAEAMVMIVLADAMLLQACVEVLR